MSIRPDVQDMIDYLNDLLKVDRVFVQELFSQRFVCNRDLAYHPTVQVVEGGEDLPEIRPGEYRCGLLGMLNGYFGTFDSGTKKDWGAISSNYDDGFLASFSLITNEVKGE